MHGETMSFVVIEGINSPNGYSIAGSDRARLLRYTGGSEPAAQRSAGASLRSPLSTK